MKTTSTFMLTLALALAAQLAAPSHAQNKRRQKTMEPAIVPPPVSVVNNPAPQYLSGEVSVTVRSNENPIIRLGLAQHGVALIEFPANDRFFAINPGNPELVTIEDSPTKETDRFFVMRAGNGFLPVSETVKSSAPATSIIVQMNSGMVVTFLIYPARDIEHNAHRCVVMYDPKAITDARRAAGLSIHLDRTEKKESSGKQPVASIRMTTPADAAKEALPIVPLPPPVATINESKPAKPAAKPTLIDYPVLSGREQWSKPLHGIRLAVQTRVLDARQRQVLVTVQNTLGAPIKIIASHPALQIQTLDDRGRVLQVEPLVSLQTESSVADGMVAAKQTVRYLLTYEAPLLGAKQRLTVGVAQANAADEPATMELTTGTR